MEHPWRITFPAGRARGVTAAVTGIAAALWLGWAGASTPNGWAAPLGAGILLAAGVGVAGASVAFVAPRASPSPGRRGGRRYWTALAVKAAGLVAGAAVLGGLGDRRWVPVWVAAVVAVQLVASTVALDDGSFLVLGALVAASAAAGLAANFSAGMSPGPVASGGVGVALLAYGTLTLLSGLPAAPPQRRRTRIRVIRRREPDDRVGDGRR